MTPRLPSVITSGVLLAAVTACGVTLGSRSITENLPAVTVPGAALPAELGLSLGLALSSPELDIGAESALVTFISVRDLILQIQQTSETQDSIEDGAPDNFDFLTSANIFIRGEFEDATRIMLIATLPENDPQIGAATRNLDFTVVDNNVFDFLLLPNGYDIVLELEGSIPADNVTFTGQLTYRVGIGF